METRLLLKYCITEKYNIYLPLIEHIHDIDIRRIQEDIHIRVQKLLIIHLTFFFTKIMLKEISNLLIISSVTWKLDMDNSDKTLYFM